MAEEQHVTDGFGTLLKEIRKDQNLTQERLAQLAGLSADAIRRLEWGRSSPKLETLVKLSKALVMSLPAMFSALETQQRNEAQEISDYILARSPEEQAQAVRIIRALFNERPPRKQVTR